ncbi:uncharacterized protein PAC_12399 [Phialocephala subalpina]|uniref:Uncharacterized protein n=1 Tax=Phialocephala subalpina TaxID=576137 RepID=A0A1L7XBV5_9HELO|nr:uncharacterized protein PAC_12399 [Phialocephala subalpina]
MLTVSGSSHHSFARGINGKGPDSPISNLQFVGSHCLFLSLSLVIAVANLEVLSPGEGYGIVIGFGVGFTLIMIVLSLIQNRYGKHNTFKSTEELNAASRSVKPGMIAAASCQVGRMPQSAHILHIIVLLWCWGGLWYGAVGTFQTLFFAVAAFKIKEKSNNAHTFPEIVLQKHGKIAHVVFTFFGLVTNLINGSTLTAGGCAVFASLTGMNIWAAYWILPAIVTAYIVVSSLRATFICDYLLDQPPHWIAFLTRYLLKDKEVTIPADFYNGSYMAVDWRDGLVTAATIFLGGFSAVWTDQVYGQRAIASQPATAVKGNVLRSFAWYAIPFAMPSTLGLVAAAPTRNIRLTCQIECGSSLCRPCIYQSKGDYSILVSGFRLWANPYGTALTAISCIFHSVEISPNWLIKVLGCLLKGGAIPMACVLLWDRASTFAVIVSPIIGLISGLTSWMMATRMRSGVINITATSNVWSSLTGDYVSLGMGGTETLPPDEKTGRVVEENIAAHGPKPIEGEEYVAEEALTPDEVKSQKRLAWLSLIFGSLIFMIVSPPRESTSAPKLTQIQLDPFTLLGTGYNFSVHFFTVFIVIVFLWLWASFVICVFMPLWESRRDMWYIAGAIYRDLIRSKVHYSEKKGQSLA